GGLILLVLEIGEPVAHQAPRPAAPGGPVRGPGPRGRPRCARPAPWRPARRGYLLGQDDRGRQADPQRPRDPCRPCATHATPPCFCSLRSLQWSVVSGQWSVKSYHAPPYRLVTTATDPPLGLVVLTRPFLTEAGTGSDGASPAHRH